MFGNQMAPLAHLFMVWILQAYQPFYQDFDVVFLLLVVLVAFTIN